MPAFYVIDKDRKAVFSSGKGMLTAADLMGHQERILKDPEFDPRILSFWTSAALPGSRLHPRTSAAWLRRTFFRLIRGAHSRQDELQYGLSRMLNPTRYAGETGIRVFRTLDEAMNWIFSRTPDTEPPVAV